MNYLHSSIRKSQKILNAIPLPEPYFFLIIFSDYVQIVEIQLSSLQLQECFPLDCGIRFAASLQNEILILSQEAVLCLLSNEPPFRKIFSFNISYNSFSPSSLCIAHSILNFSQTKFLSSAFSATFVIVNLESNSYTKLEFQDRIVLGVAASSDPNQFYILFSISKNSKIISLIDVESELEVQFFPVDNDTLFIFSFFDIRVSFNFGRFTSKLLILNDESFDLPSHPYSYFISPNGFLFYQLEDGSFFFFDGVPIHLGVMTLVNKFCPLPGHLVCICEQSFVISVLWELRDYSLICSSDHIFFHLTSPITSACFFEEKLMLCSTKRIEFIKNSLDFSLETMESPTKSFKEAFSFGQNFKIFAVDSNTIAVSSDRITSVLEGPTKMLVGPTLVCGEYESKFIQVSTQQIKVLNDDRLWQAPSNIIIAAISPRSIIVGFKNFRTILFGSNLKTISDIEIPHASKFAFCGQWIAVVTNTLVTIYTPELTPSDIFFQLNSNCHSLHFFERENTLFVSTTNGNVLKFVINFSELSHSSSIIYASSSPGILLPHPNGVLIFSDKLFLYTNKMLVLKMPRPITIAAGFEENEYVLISQSMEIQRLKILDSLTDYIVCTVQCDYSPRKVSVSGHGAYVICEDKMMAIWQKDSLNFKPFPGNLTSISSTKNSFITSFQSEEMRYSVQLSGEQEFIWEEKSPPTAVCSNGYLTYIAGKSYLHEHSKSEDGMWGLKKSTLCLLPCPAHLILQGGFLWVGDRIRSVLCFKSPVDGTCPIAIDTEPRRISAMALLNDFTICAGDDYGNITFLLLTRDCVNQKIWRKFRNPDIFDYSNEMSGRLLKIASMNVRECVTSILVKGESVFYTTLFGKIGVLVPVLNDADFSSLSTVENFAGKAYLNEFGLWVSRQLDPVHLRVVDGDIFDYLSLLPKETQDYIESQIKSHSKSISGLLTRLRIQTKF